MNQPNEMPADSQRNPETAAELREIPSEQLLAGKAEVLIRHGEDIYRLRLTRNGKLILQK